MQDIPLIIHYNATNLQKCQKQLNKGLIHNTFTIKWWNDLVLLSQSNVNTVISCLPNCCGHWSSLRQSESVLRPRDRITPARGLIRTQQTHKNVSGPTNRRDTSKALHYFAHSPGLLRKQQSTWTKKTAQSTKKTPKKNTWGSVAIETTWWEKDDGKIV